MYKNELWAAAGEQPVMVLQLAHPHADLPLLWCCCALDTSPQKAANNSQAAQSGVYSFTSMPAMRAEMCHNIVLLSQVHAAVHGLRTGMVRALKAQAASRASPVCCRLLTPHHTQSAAACNVCCPSRCHSEVQVAVPGPAVPKQLWPPQGQLDWHNSPASCP